MHYYIYPEKDTFITNKTDYDDKNFGVDEILEIGTSNETIQTVLSTKTYTYTTAAFVSQSFSNFTGIFTGSFNGTVSESIGTISGSDLIFTASYFSGSIDGTILEKTASSIISGSLIDGILSGSIDTNSQFIGIFEGQLTSSNVCFYGSGSGVETKNEENWTTIIAQYVNRSLIRFDLTTISSSISSGDISDPTFILNLKVSNEYQLPISYSIYAFPISQSWNMGNGYWSDDGSDLGVSWKYRDNNYSEPWFSPYISGSRGAINFVSDRSLATQSYGYGGGTWYTGSIASQSFNYEPSDIKMDVSSIVMQWISSSIPNNGFILMSSDELIETGSGFILKFYSTDTNTIYSPYLDVEYNDFSFSTGSISTQSVSITDVGPWISSSIQSGSTFNIIGGISGSFSGSSFINLSDNYVTASHLGLSGSLIQRFTGSVTGSFIGVVQDSQGTISGSNLIFTASYFSGSIDGNVLETSGSLTGSNVTGSISGSITSYTSFGYYSGSLSASYISMSGDVSGYFLDTYFDQFSGFISGHGLTGNILGDHIYGNVYGLITIATTSVYLPQDMITLYATEPNEYPYATGYVTTSNTPYNSFIDLYYDWGQDNGWSSTLPLLPEYPFTASCGQSYDVNLMTGTFTNGFFSGSNFIAYYNNYEILFATLSASFSENDLLGAYVNILIPSGMDPYAYAYISGSYVNGTALGKYTLSGSSSASFNGQFVDGILIGGYVNFQLSGSVYTSSYLYTSSVDFTSSFISPLNISRPFSINVQNIQSEYRRGDIIKFNIFGRKKYPLKYFGKSTEQEQYLVPEYLPTSSYYSIKDNQTDEIIIDFDEYTKISCEYPDGNFFYINTISLWPERYYRILIQIKNSDSTYTIDTGKIFKIVRGDI